MRIGILLAALAMSAVQGFPQSKPQTGTPAEMILTVADHTSHKPAALKPDDVRIVNATITDWQPLTASGDLELYLLIDDAANYDFTSKLKELRQFVADQPASVPIGIAYIHDGALQLAQSPTTYRTNVSGALRVPSGSKAANPYCALSDLIEQWPKKSLRREIVVVTTGIDDTTRGAVCVNAETTIRTAERAGVEIFALYNPMANNASETWSSKVGSGVTDLAHVCYETGGEAYFQGHSAMDLLYPYLSDIAEHLAHQYLVKFRLSGATGSGFQSVYVSSVSPNVEIMAPESVWIPLPKK